LGPENTAGDPPGHRWIKRRPQPGGQPSNLAGPQRAHGGQGAGDGFHQPCLAGASGAIWCFTLGRDFVQIGGAGRPIGCWTRWAGKGGPFNPPGQTNPEMVINFQKRGAQLSGAGPRVGIQSTACGRRPIGYPTCRRLVDVNPAFLCRGRGRTQHTEFPKGGGTRGSGGHFGKPQRQGAGGGPVTTAGGGQACFRSTCRLGQGPGTTRRRGPVVAQAPSPPPRNGGTAGPTSPGNNLFGALRPGAHKRAGWAGVKAPNRAKGIQHFTGNLRKIPKWHAFNGSGEQGGATKHLFNYDPPPGITLDLGAGRAWQPCAS